MSEKRVVVILPDDVSMWAWAAIGSEVIDQLATDPPSVREVVEALLHERGWERVRFDVGGGPEADVWRKGDAVSGTPHRVGEAVTWELQQEWRITPAGREAIG